MRLPNPLELEYHNMMINLEKERTLNYITSAEYFGIQKGIEQGKQEGMQQGIHQARREVAKKMLEKGLDYALVKEITGLTDADLADLI